MGINILFIPWRDFNSMKREGFRVREANLLLELIKNPAINKIICINHSKLPEYVSKILNFLNIYSQIRYERGVSDNNYFEKEIIISKSFFSTLKQVNTKLFVLDINYHFPNKGNKLEKILIFKKILEKEIKNALKLLNLNTYLTWCFDLARIKIANKLRRQLLIFDAIDNLLEHNQLSLNYKYFKEMYKYVERESNIIFTVSEEIKKRLFPNHRNTYYIPNGINFDLYSKEIFKERPEDLPNNNNPIVGYVGLMQERIDLDILLLAVEKNCSIDFVFVGPILSIGYFDELQKYKNVFFLGAKHYDEIPNYIKWFDICIIPHKVNKFTKSMSPLKLYEYLALKKEVITTPVPPSNEYKKVIHITDTAREFSNRIEKCIKNPFEKFKEEDILAIIVDQDWSNRLEYMFRIIKEYGNIEIVKGKKGYK